ncbi:phenylalanine--tRNA ligase subunit beta [Methanocaldococcus infernus]
MPTVNVKKYDLERLVNMPLEDEFIEKTFPMMGIEVENIYEEEGEKIIQFSVNPNRPDYLSSEGLARGFRGFIGIEKGLPKYEVEDSDVKLYSTNKSRPYIALAVVKGIIIDDYVLENLINFQEKLHWVMGRDRKKVAIGIHDFDKVKPPFYYRDVKGDEVKFIPLNSDEEMTPKEILEKHEKGIKYRHLIKDSFPLLEDSEGNILSMPPIINSNLTKVTTETRNLLIDVTGTDKWAVEKTLNIIVTALAERKYAKIHSVEVIYENEKVKYPNLKEEVVEVSPDYINKILGTNLTPGAILNYLRKARMDAQFIENKFKVFVPPYRVDIFGEIDIAEEVAICYGYDKFKGLYPEIATIGSLHPLEKRCDFIRDIMIGLGFYEVINLMLSNEEVLFKNMRLDIKDYIEVLKPASIEHKIVRPFLLPIIMETVRINQHKELPIKIFEIGECINIKDNKIVETKNIAGAIVSNETNFNEIKSYVEALLRELKLTYKIEEYEHPSFIKGRCAKILVDNEEIGYFGEIHPEVLENFEIEFPVTAFEVILK